MNIITTTLKSGSKYLVLLLLMFVYVTDVSAAVCTTCFSRASGNLTTGAIWATTTGVGGGSIMTFDANSVIIVERGYTVTQTASID